MNEAERLMKIKLMKIKLTSKFKSKNKLKLQEHGKCKDCQTWINIFLEQRREIEFLKTENKNLQILCQEYIQKELDNESEESEESEEPDEGKKDNYYKIDYDSMTSQQAYDYACIHGPCNITRNIAFQDRMFTYQYARDVDCLYREDTNDVLTGTPWEYEYKNLFV